ncbi:MAG: HDOD domain-containing protein [Pseudomonadota bacterium]
MSTEKNIDRIVRTIDSIPTLPVISMQIEKLFRNENVSTRQIEDLIQHDPPLATKLLKLVNSSFYGLINKVSTIDHALIILGFNEVRNVALGFAIQNHFTPSSKSFDPKRFWKHSIICSQIAKFLGKHFNMVDDGTFFLSGLIHDIGKLVIDQYFKDEFAAIIDYIEVHKSSFSKAEKEILGVTHYQIAAKLLQQWHFPRKVIMQIFYHHAPWYDKNFTSGSIILYLANILTKISGYTCFEKEKEVADSDIMKPGTLEYLNKNGFELDEVSLKKLQNLINECITAESDNVLKIFD